MFDDDDIKPYAWTRRGEHGPVYTKIPSVAAIWVQQGCPVMPLYAAPSQPSQKALEDAAAALVKIVEGIDGAMNHGTWRDELGMRLKDTPEWVALYVALGQPAPEVR